MILSLFSTCKSCRVSLYQMSQMKWELFSRLINRDLRLWTLQGSSSHSSHLSSHSIAEHQRSKILSNSSKINKTKVSLARIPVRSSKKLKRWSTHQIITWLISKSTSTTTSQGARDLQQQFLQFIRALAGRTTWLKLQLPLRCLFPKPTHRLTEKGSKELSRRTSTWRQRQRMLRYQVLDRAKYSPAEKSGHWKTCTISLDKRVQLG